MLYAAAHVVTKREVLGCHAATVCHLCVSIAVYYLLSNLFGYRLSVSPPSSLSLKAGQKQSNMVFF